MTKKLEEIFGFDQLEPIEPAEDTKTPDETRAAIVEIDADIDKIDAALPGVRDLNSSDQELDDIANRAVETFENLTDLGMNVDSRFSAELFAVAGTMLGHALTAKQTKLQKKLKVIELQMKKLKLDQDQARMAAKGEIDDPISAKGQVLNRNDLLEMLKSSRDQNNNKA
jgi:hypothetical protein